MKSKKYIFFTILILIISFIRPIFATTDRLVDIPVPPNSSGYADFTEEEAAEREREYEESKNNNAVENNLIGKSDDNYLKSLNVEGYNLNPEFNRQIDTYTIYVKDDSINTFNVKAEPNNENAKVEGVGSVTVTPEQRIINIKVIAENGNLKVYTINVENEVSMIQNYNGNINIGLIIIVIVILIVIVIFIYVKKKNK